MLNTTVKLGYSQIVFCKVMSIYIFIYSTQELCASTKMRAFIYDQ